MKPYNDYILASEESQKVIRQKMDDSLESEIRDLEDIYKRMQEEKSLLISNNNDGRLNSAIKAIDNNLIRLASILHKCTSSKRHHAQKKPLKSGNYGTHIFNVSDEAHGKIPSSDAISRNQENPVIQPPSPTQEENTSPTRNIRRGSPMQGNILSILAKKIFLKPRQEIMADIRQNRFHNTFIQESCDPRKKMITGQFDILRLLLLYLSMRPYSRYCPIICNITSSQLDVLGYLID